MSKLNFVVITSHFNGNVIVNGPFKELAVAREYVDSLKDDEYWASIERDTSIMIKPLLPPEK
jgi:hypothetical protein